MVAGWYSTQLNQSCPLLPLHQILTLAEPKEQNQYVRIIDIVGLNKLINLRCHSVFKQPIKFFFSGTEGTLDQLEDTFRQLKERPAIQDLVLSASKHDCFQDNL